MLGVGVLRACSLPARRLVLTSRRTPVRATALEARFVSSHPGNGRKFKGKGASGNKLHKPSQRKGKGNRKSAMATRASADDVETSAAAGFEFRLASYNLQSQALANKESYPFLEPDALDAEKRYRLVVEKLEEELEQSKGGVLALQELSRTWSGRLLPFFSDRGYTVVQSLYGTKFNDYMGVALVFPHTQYKLLDADIVRAVDTTRWPRHEPGPPQDPPLLRIAKSIQKLFAQAFGIIATYSGAGSLYRALFPAEPRVRPPKDPWHETKRRVNTMVSLRLQDKETGAKFCVSTYHMPCAFQIPPVMVMHSRVAARRAHSFAAGDPYVLTGDFNLQPGSGGYRLLTEGRLPADHEELPQVPEGFTWEPTIPTPLTSAYKAVNGEEPEFTNYTYSLKSTEIFCAPLDYIFCSPAVKPLDVKPLPARADAMPSPNKDEPSDHILIAASLRVPRP